MQPDSKPVELFDSFKWEDRSKIITRDVHRISGLMNFTHFSHLAAEPSTSMHFHTGIMEIHCIVKGRSMAQLYLDGHMKTITYTGGEALVIFPGEYHARGNENLQEPCELYAMQLNLAEETNFLGLNERLGAELCHRLMALPSRVFTTGTDDISLLRQAFALFSTRREEDRNAGLAHLVCFLYRFLTFEPVEMTLPGDVDAHIHQAIDYLSENISEPISLVTLAEIAGYSLSRFKTMFREETGVTPAHYINMRKVEHAKRELERTDLPITEIGCNLGWSSGNYFCTVFKKLTGMSPLQYRKEFSDNLD